MWFGVQLQGKGGGAAGSGDSVRAETADSDWTDCFFPLLILVSAGAWRVGIAPRLKKCQEGWRLAGLACAVNTH